jgi:hypothetical protein
VAFRLSPKKWADVLHRYYVQLGGNADLVLNTMPQRLRVAAEKEQSRQMGGELLGRVRGKRTKLVYTLANLIKDTSAGAGLHDRILAFLRA